MITLSVIDGGGGGDRPRQRRKHWLAEHLWHAITYRSVRATSVQTLADRMSRTTKNKISVAQANHILNVVRSDADLYGWSVFHVAKGADDANRRFIPVLVDYEGETVYVEEEDIDYVWYGLISSARTIASMSKNEAVALELWTHVAPREHRRKLRAMQGSLMATAEMAEQVATQTLRLVQ